MKQRVTTAKIPTKYQIVQDGIRAWIESGVIAPGAKLPIEDDLASQFGVSRQTVRHAVGELVRQRLLERRQGSGTYYVDDVAPVDRPTSERVVAVICTYISDYIFPYIIQGIEETLSPQGYSILLYSTRNDASQERRALEDILAKNVTSVICEATKSAGPNANLDLFNKLLEQKKPLVMIHASYQGLAVPTVEVDDALGAFLAVDHLASLGHRRIGSILKVDDQQGLRRMEGFMRALLDRGLGSSANTVMLYTTEQLPTVVDQYLTRIMEMPAGQRPTAVFCYNDQIAIRLLQTARDVGLAIPDDLSVAGFDDSALASHAFPQLTSVIHPKRAMGALAAQHILNWLHDGVVPPLTYRFAPTLVARTSSQMSEIVNAH